jgi:uncharacterized protein
MKSYTNYLIAGAVALTASLSFAQAGGDLTAAKRAEIKTLLELTGVRAIPEQIAINSVQSMAGGIKRLDPKFPDKGFQVMKDSIQSTLNGKVETGGGLMEQVTLVYHNNFTAGEVSEMLKFYQSAAGKKLLASQGKVNAETMQTAMKWADSMGDELDKRMEEALKKENIKLPDPPSNGASGANGAAPKAPSAPKAPAKPAEAPPAKK